MHTLRFSQRAVISVCLSRTVLPSEGLAEVTLRAMLVSVCSLSSTGANSLSKACQNTHACTLLILLLWNIDSDHLHMNILVVIMVYNTQHTNMHTVNTNFYGILILLDKFIVLFAHEHFSSGIGYIQWLLHTHTSDKSRNIWCTSYTYKFTFKLTMCFLCSFCTDGRSLPQSSMDRVWSFSLIHDRVSSHNCWNCSRL